MAKLITTNIVGSADEKVWSQAQSVVGEGGNQVSIVLQLSTDDPDSIVDLATVGTEVIAEIERKAQGGIVNSELQQVIEGILSGINEGITVKILVASRTGLDVSMYGQGKVEVYLARSLQLAQLKSDWGSGEILHGQLKADDVLVLATSEFVKTIGLPEFKKIVLEDENPAEVLIPLLHKQADTSGVAAVVGVVEEDSEVAEEEVRPLWWKSMIKRGPKINSIQTVEGPRKINLMIGSVIFLLLIVMIGVGMVRRVKQIEEAKFNSLNTSITAKIDETVSVGDLNPDRARILLTQAKSEVNAYLATDAKTEYKDKAKKLMSDIELAESKAFKKNEIKLDTVVELSILADGLVSEQMKSDGKGNLIFLDKNNSRLVSMNLSDRSRQVITPKNGAKYVDTSVSDTKVYGLNDGGVSELSWKKDEVKKVIEPDEFWKSPTYMEQFAGNVYVFDREQSEIWKYPTLGDTFGSRRRWLAAGITPDLSNVVDMKVVGDIYLLTSTGKLARYSRGAPVNFGMEGFPAKGEAKVLADPRAIWVTDNAVYVLESGAGRVVVFDNDGKYESQYVSSEFGEASDIVVVDDKAYVLINNVVKSFRL